MNHRWSVFVILALLGYMFVISENSSAATGETLQVSFINVGKGDAILIHDSSGFDVLIDGGKPLGGPKVLKYLREQGVEDIDVMIATHAHIDHIGGLKEILHDKDLPVHQVLYSGYPGDTPIWDEFEEAVQDRGLTLTAAQYPMTYTWGTTTAYVLNPVSDLEKTTQNDKSVVILLDHADIEFIFTGDISASVEAAILSRYTSLEAEILKVAHHGSEYGSSATFLAALSPLEAVITVGANPSGYPHEDTLNRLQAAGARIWRTDQSGTIVVSSDGMSHLVNGLMPLRYRLYLTPIVETNH